MFDLISASRLIECEGVGTHDTGKHFVDEESKDEIMDRLIVNRTSP